MQDDLILESRRLDGAETQLPEKCLATAATFYRVSSRSVSGRVAYCHGAEIRV